MVMGIFNKKQVVKLLPELIIEKGKFERFGNTFKFKVNYGSAEAVANKPEDAVISCLRLKHPEVKAFYDVKKGN